MPTLPGPLVQTDWLEAHLADPDLRVFDCTVFRDPAQDPDEHPMRFLSGKDAWRRGHIPSAGFIDLVEELTVKGETRFMFPVPPPARFAEIVAGYGIGEGVRVVLYDGTGQSWPARVWWLLRAHGFDDAAVLDGGWAKWKAEGRAVSTGESRYPSTSFTAKLRPELTATRNEVQAALGGTETCLVNTLSREDFEGTAPPRYGRSGRIPSSVSVPVTTLFDDQTGVLLTPEGIAERFGAVGALDGKRVITY